VNFSNPYILLGLLAVSAPIIIHLLNRRRHKTIKWAAMEFILKATRESRGKKKLKHLIILTARALIIAALVFAFAEPLTNKFGINGIPDTVVLVLDRSPSMELVTNEGTAGGGLSKRELAIRNVQETMKDMPKTRLLLLDSATQKLTEISSPDALTSMSQAGQSDKSANLPKLISSAVGHLVDNSDKLGNTEVWVASDMQASDWDLKAKQWKSVNSLVDSSENVKLRFLALKEQSDDNNSVRVMKSSREGNELVLDVEIFRSGTSPDGAVSITYAVNGGQQTDDILMNSESKIIRKRISLQSSVKKGYGYVSLNADANLRDNVSYFVFGEKTALETVIVSDGGASLPALERAAALPTFGHLSANLVKPNEIRDISFDSTPLVIWQSALPTGSTADKIKEYIENGGLVLFFPPNEDSTDEFLDIKWGPVQQAPKDSFFVVSNWNQNDGPFRDGLSGDSLPLSLLDAIKRRQIVGDTVALGSYDDGEVFSTRKVLGSGRAVFVSTLPDLAWSQMDHIALHLIIVHRMLELATERYNATGAADVGSELLDLRPRENRERIDDYSKSAPNNAENEAGVWQLGQRTIASNRPIIEDAPELIEDDQLEEVLPDANYTLLENRGNDEASSVIFKWWTYFLIGGILFLIIEALLTMPKKVKLKKA